MIDNIEEIKKKIYQFCLRAYEDFKDEKITSLTGVRADNYCSLLSGFSAMLEERFAELELKSLDFKASQDPELSEAKLDRLWKTTELGREQIKIKHLLRGVDKVISALKRRLRRLENEAYNIT